jgi:hypothetical protein
MPKITDGITSDDRKQAIREILNQHGKITREELFSMVSSRLNVDPKNIRSSLYKDLTTLSDKGIIERQYLHLDGTPMIESEISAIELDEENSNKKYKLLWSIKGYETSIIGLKVLENLGGQFYLPNQSMQRDFAIMDATKSTQLGSFSVIFEIGNKILKLALDEHSCPATIVFGRAPEATFVFPRAKFIEEFGKRAALLLLPNRLLSSCKTDGRLGHFSVTFNTAKEVSIRDLGSKNGLKSMRLSKDNLAKLDLRLCSYPGETTTIQLSEVTYTESEARCINEEVVKELLPTMLYVPGGFAVFLR